MNKSLTYPWQVLWIVMIGTFMGALDASIVNISVPVLMNRFLVGTGEIQWVITSYMIGYAVFMPLTSWLKTRLGLKRLYLTALTVFMLGSLLCGIAPNLPFLVAARVVQALGGGAMAPTAMALVAQVFSERERGRALGYWGLGVIIGPAIGPTLGGLITEYWSWRGIFLVNVPIGIAGLYWAAKKLRPDFATPQTHIRPPFDSVGFVSLGVTLTSLIYGVSLMEHVLIPWSQVGWCLLLTVASGALFIAYEFRTPYPLVDLRIFKNTAFTACVLVTMSRSAALFGGLFIVPILLQKVMGLTETVSGLVMLPGSLLMAGIMPLSGGWSDRNGPRGIVFAGLAISTVSMVLLGWIGSDTVTLWVVAVMLVRGFGMGLLITPISTETVNSVPESQITQASSLSSLLQQVGGAVGVATLGAFYQFRVSHGALLDMAVKQERAIQETFYLAAILMLFSFVPFYFFGRKSIQ